MNYRDQSLPTLEDYQELVRAYQELQEHSAEQAKRVKEIGVEAQVKDEVLKRQSEDIKKLEGTISRLETELLWNQAALQEATAAAQANQKQGDESWQERYQRLQGEVDQLRIRWEQRYESSVTEARNQILLDMLPLADHLDLALQHAAKTDQAAIQSYVDNIESTRRAFLETLRRYGVERMDAEGAQFDPNLHEAIGYVEDGETPANHIMQVVQAGYRDGERLLRPARVIVSKG
ncbi:MAG: nucleotide exchange factor GrpE [Caldilineaceae bacterium]